ncbi:MAG: ADP-ribosylation factor-like protein [Candidatus Hodarchaeota archaeon]
MDELKIIVSGLDNAGKTSILTSFNKRYDFEEEVRELQPTIRVSYQQTKFLGKNFHFWDMGGQEMYRELYQSRQDLYFADTNLLIYVIDIQDSDRFDSSLEYLHSILQYFDKNKMDVPLIVAFHKFDPELKNDENLIKFARKLTEKLIQIEQLKMLFLQTSIYDILSIVHLISSALSIFDDKHLKLKELFKNYLKDFDSKSLILFDQNGVIISEFYTESVGYDLYLDLLKSIKEHIIVLKKIQKENYEYDSDFNPINNQMGSYLRRIKLKDDTFYVSLLINENAIDTLSSKFSDFLIDLNSFFT